MPALLPRPCRTTCDPRQTPPVCQIHTQCQGRLELRPGELFIGSGQGQVATLLGSCIAVTLHHRETGLSAMCHFLLATRQRQRQLGQDRFFGNYGDEVIAYLMDEYLDQGIRPAELAVGLFGGGSFHGLSNRPGKMPIGSTNLAVATRLLKAFGVKSHQEHAGGTGYRRVCMNLETGTVAVKFTSYAT